MDTALGSAYHFWYFIALLFSIIVVGIAYKLGRIKQLLYIAVALYGIGLLGTSYYSIGSFIPGISYIVTAD